MTEKRLGKWKRICWKGWRIETWEKAWKSAQEKAGVKQMVSNRIKWEWGEYRHWK